MNNLIAEQIADRVTIPQILSYYGYPTSRRKRIPCPLHMGRKPNFCYTDKVFHCWTCSEKGNVIGLTMKLFGITFPQALMKLDKDFSLGLSTGKPTYRERQQMAEVKKVNRAYEQWKERKNRMYNGLCVFHRELLQLVIKNPENKEILDMQQSLEYWLDENIGEVVQAWN